MSFWLLLLERAQRKNRITNTCRVSFIVTELISDNQLAFLICDVSYSFFFGSVGKVADVQV